MCLATVSSFLAAMQHTVTVAAKLYPQVLLEHLLRWSLSPPAVLGSYQTVLSVGWPLPYWGLQAITFSKPWHFSGSEVREERWGGLSKYPFQLGRTPLHSWCWPVGQFSTKSLPLPGIFTVSGAHSYISFVSREEFSATISDLCDRLPGVLTCLHLRCKRGHSPSPSYSAGG